MKHKGVYGAIVLVALNVAFLWFMRHARQTPVIHDSGQMQCGHWAIVRCSHLLGVPVSVRRVFELLPLDERGHSMADLTVALESIGFVVTPKQGEFAQIISGEPPTILHLTDPDHFVVVSRSSTEDVIVFDANGVRRRLKMPDVERRFDGYALQVASSEDAKNRRREECQSTACLHFETLYLDHGDIAINSGPVEYQFHLENLGGAVLEIHDVAADCGCVQVSSPKTIAPHSKDVIKAYFRHDSASQRASFEHEILVRTNDPTTPNISLVAAGNTDTTLRVWPLDLDFGACRAGHSHLFRCFVQYSGDEEEILDEAEFECTFPDTTVRVLTREAFLEESPPAAGLVSRRNLRGHVRIVELTWRPLPSAIPAPVTGVLRINVPRSGVDPIAIPVRGSIVEIGRSTR